MATRSRSKVRPPRWLVLAGISMVLACTLSGIQAAARGRAARSESAERARRLAADLHDGVGTRLLALATSMDPGDLTQRRVGLALQDCLLDLQVTIDGIDACSHSSVAARLGSLRYRIQPAFDRLGMRLQWSVADTEDLRLSNPDAHEVCKLAQEALANVLGHSKARQVSVRWGSDARGCPTLDVVDDGVGLPNGGLTAAHGRGVLGMHARARALGAQLWIQAAMAGGTHVRLVLPHPGG